MYKILCLIGIITAGCTHTQQMSNQKISREEMYVKFNQYAQKREGEIKLMDGVIRKGKSFRIESDSIRFIDKFRTQEMKISITDVESVSFISTGRGMLQGAAIGALAGFTFGYSLFYLHDGKGNVDEDHTPMRAVAPFGGGLFGGFGMICGALLGTKGAGQIFIFNTKITNKI